MTTRPPADGGCRKMKSYTARYWGGPLDGGEEQIECGYPPDELRGYRLAYSKLGRYYKYIWGDIKARRPDK